MEMRPEKAVDGKGACNITRGTRERDSVSSGDKVQSLDGVRSMEVQSWRTGMESEAEGLSTGLSPELCMESRTGCDNVAV